ncbi:hypothetical protein [Jeotgalibacillus soli]|uniref:Uncharacterized protein n=1 Tax=Jeotgalibacillus soli TaxID=889306 RepID=A0A0C2S7R8_9BACL|nr:hypothetical protein [Jeotgalibacillus soli]KIL50034.1 hypothetical protein KP78_15020 [Jeotgalibacillus soli]
MSLGARLNEVLNLGDKIRVKIGDDNIDGTGSFIQATDDFLVWADDDGEVLFTVLGGGVSIKKV